MIISESNYKTLFSGCAHNGIVNILNRAGDIAKQEMKYCISGFHLYDPLKKRTENINLIKDIANTFYAEIQHFILAIVLVKKPMEY